MSTGGDVAKFGLSKLGQTLGGQRAAGSSASDDKEARDESYVIVVPAAATSLITMANAREFFEDGVYISAAEKREKVGMCRMDLYFF